MAMREGKLEILPDRNNHCGFWHPGIHFGTEIIPLDLSSKTISKWNNAEWLSRFSVSELTTSQGLMGAALPPEGIGSGRLSHRHTLSLYQEQMHADFAHHPSRRACSAWAPNTYKINATTLTNICCLSGNTYSFRLCVMPTRSHRFWISDCTSSGHLPYTVQIHLWVEKLRYHALAYNFTRFPLKSCFLSLTFIIRMEVQKHTYSCII